eukprot:1187368-Prorocentrum_minimum.AAC.1
MVFCTISEFRTVAHFPPLPQDRLRGFRGVRPKGKALRRPPEVILWPGEAGLSPPRARRAVSRVAPAAWAARGPLHFPPGATGAASRRHMSNIELP